MCGGAIAQLTEALGGIAGPRWSEELVAPFLVHLREHRGYTNIAWFNLMNEPAGLPDGAGGRA